MTPDTLRFDELERMAREFTSQPAGVLEIGSCSLRPGAINYVPESWRGGFHFVRATYTPDQSVIAWHRHRVGGLQRLVQRLRAVPVVVWASVAAFAALHAIATIGAMQ